MKFGLLAAVKTTRRTALMSLDVRDIEIPEAEATVETTPEATDVP